MRQLVPTLTLTLTLFASAALAQPKPPATTVLAVTIPAGSQLGNVVDAPEGYAPVAVVWTEAITGTDAALWCSVPDPDTGIPHIGPVFDEAGTYLTIVAPICGPAPCPAAYVAISEEWLTGLSGCRSATVISNALEAEDRRLLIVFRAWK